MPLLSSALCVAMTTLFQTQVAATSKIHGAAFLVHSPSLTCTAAAGEAAPGRSMSPSDLFRTASVSKMYTAAAVLRLAEQGVFSLDTLFQQLMPQRYGAFTVRQLLNHSSGLADYVFDDPRFAPQVLQHPDAQWNSAAILRSYETMEHRTVFKPGSGFHYADTNYVLLALLIEHVTGTSYQDAVRKLILAPARMDDTYLEWYEPKRSGRFLSHAYLGKRDAATINTSYDWGGGGYASTLTDLDRFIRCLFASGFYTRRETLATMLLSHPPGQPQQGLGIRGLVVDGVQFYGHAGAWGDLVLYAPSLDLSLVLTVNQFDEVGVLNLARATLHLATNGRQG